MRGGLENAVVLWYFSRGHTVYDNFSVVGGIYSQYNIYGPEMAVFLCTL